MLVSPSGTSGCARRRFLAFMSDSTPAVEPSAPAIGPLVRVGLVSVGDPASPSTWSGTTASVMRALSELDVVVHGLDLTLPRVLERAVLAAGAARTRNSYDKNGAAVTMAIRSRLARRRLSGAQLDGLIQIGSGFVLPDGVPYVTLEDMTLRQGRAVHPFFTRMSEHGIASWEKRRIGIFDRARMCTVASHWAAESLFTDYGVARKRIAGLGANHNVTAPDRVWQSPRFLFVGSDWERKGGPLLLRTFARVREVYPDAMLDVVGGHPQLRQPGVHAHGVLSQARPEDRELIAELYARATCFVMPSLVEPFGLVHVEAGSAGIPSIVTTEGGARDTIGADGGLAVQPGDEEGLLEAMLRLANPETARQMGKAARERSRLYTWTKVSERLLRALGLQAPDGRTLAEFL